MKAFLAAVLAGVLGVLPVLPSGAQVLVHRYSFNGNARDSVGTAHGTVVGSVSFSAARGVNGGANFSGDTSGSNPGYIRLPVSTVSGLQNATVELFTTNFDMPPDGRNFQALFAVGASYGNQTNYAILAANRAGSGLGVGARRNNLAETVVAARDPLPVWRQNHVVHLVYSGFSGIGSTGTQTLYLDGVPVAQGQTVFSLAAVAAGTGGISTVGIGGGSPFNDPTFRGSMNEVRIYDGALTPQQIAANLDAGPGRIGLAPTAGSLTLTALTALPLPGAKARITWTTSNPADTTVEYGRTAAYGRTVTVAGTRTKHSAALTHLRPFTVYHYRVRSRDALGQVVTSPDATFTVRGALGVR